MGGSWGGLPSGSKCTEISHIGPVASRLGGSCERATMHRKAAYSSTADQRHNCNVKLHVMLAKPGLSEIEKTSLRALLITQGNWSFSCNRPEDNDDDDLLWS